LSNELEEWVVSFKVAEGLVHNGGGHGGFDLFNADERLCRRRRQGATLMEMRPAVQRSIAVKE
jgi:hypothetical protein